MTDFFTIISLVLSVSGATYAALVAIRSWLNDRLSEKLKTSDQHLNFLNGDETSIGSLKEQANASKKWMDRWNNLWSFAFATPIVLFMLATYGQCIHLLWFYWGVDNISAINSDAWQFYKWFLFGLLAIDVICVLLTFGTFGGIYWNCRSIKERYDTAIEAQAKKVKEESEEKSSSPKKPTSEERSTPKD